MDQNEKWLQWAVELQAIAQNALTYCENPFDRERFEQVRRIAADIVSHQAQISQPKVQELFCGETGYQTPKLDCRAAIFKDDKILLVKERDGKWSLPGGWVDVHLSVKENTIKEVKEEAGLDVTAGRVIAVLDRERHNQPVYAWRICKIFVECTVIGGSFAANIETLASDYFTLDRLPPLAAEKNNEEQIRMCFDAYHAEHWETLFD